MSTSLTLDLDDYDVTFDVTTASPDEGLPAKITIYHGRNRTVIWAEAKHAAMFRAFADALESLPARRAAWTDAQGRKHDDPAPEPTPAMVQAATEDSFGNGCPQDYPQGA